jgi:hypothetical protein
MIARRAYPKRRHGLIAWYAKGLLASRQASGIPPDGPSAKSLTFAAAPAAARVNVDVVIGVPSYVHPTPVYVYPQPVYLQPQPVYVTPRPVYVQPIVHMSGLTRFLSTAIAIIDGMNVIPGADTIMDTSITATKEIAFTAII